MNSDEAVKRALELLKAKGTLTAEDIAVELHVSMSTAYNIFRVVKALCPTCREEKVGRKTVLKA